MTRFIRQYRIIIGLILFWVLCSAYAPPLTYVVLPLSVLLLRRREMWAEMLFGFLICLVLSDMHQDIRPMAVMKTAKYTYIIVLALIFFSDQERFKPLARIFPLFLPFFVYAFFPIIRSVSPISSVEKTISYALLFLVVPNLVLFNFRKYGWEFFRDLVWFIVLILVSQQLLRVFAPPGWSIIDERFRGYFGNPNGLAIFVYLTFVLFVVVNQMRSDLFSKTSKLFIYALLIYYIITCGARTSLMSTLMFLLFIQFFRVSTFLGIISFVAFIGIGEVISSNLPTIISAFGLQEYLRVDTIADGSGRYMAWNYAWQQINEKGFFFFGGGFDNEYWLMYEARHYLSKLGHQGGVHNSYLAFWLNTGIVGLFLYLRGFVLVFIKATKETPVAMAIMFSVLFSILYESWLAGSLNPYTILLLIILTIVSEEEILGSAKLAAPDEEQEEQASETVPQLILPAR